MSSNYEEYTKNNSLPPMPTACAVEDLLRQQWQANKSAHGVLWNRRRGENLHHKYIFCALSRLCYDIWVHIAEFALNDILLACSDKQVAEFEQFF